MRVAVQHLGGLCRLSKFDLHSCLNESELGTSLATGRVCIASINSEVAKVRHVSGVSRDVAQKVGPRQNSRGMWPPRVAIGTAYELHMQLMASSIIRRG